MADASLSPFRSILTRLAGSRDRDEKARLEAFLRACPQAYCGFTSDGGAAYSPSFCTLFGLPRVAGIADIQSVLSPGDAAALESLFSRLQSDGLPFSQVVRLSGKARTLRLTGARGQDSEGTERLDVIWADDISADFLQREKAARQQQDNQENLDRLQTVLDEIPVPLWLRNTHTEIIWCNRAYVALTGGTAASVVADQKEIPVKAGARKATGKTSARSPGPALAQAALESGRTESAQAHVISGGSRRLMDVQESPLPAHHMVLGMARDITREEELETEQKRNSTANKELLEQLGSAIAIFDAGQRLEFHNSSFGQLWKLEDAYLNARPKLGDIMEKLREQRRLPEQVDFRRFKDSWLSMFTGLITPHEEMLYLPGGSALRMLAVPHPMGGLMMTFEDVTSRLELESSYNTLIAVQRETLDNLAEGVAVFGGDGRLRLYNPAFARLWNLPPEQLDGHPHVTKIAEGMKLRFAPETREQGRRTLVNHSLDRRLSDGRLTCADGVLLTYSTVPLPDGGVLVTYVDVTDKARAESALREKNVALETAERLKLDFLANVSYQLRTPLNAIMGFAEMLDHEYFGKLNPRQKEYSGGIREAGQRLVSLIDDILDLSTIEAGYMQLYMDNVAIGDIVKGLYELTVEWARKEGLSVSLDCPADIGNLRADERRLKQALLNLIRNAINFTPAGGKIALAAKRLPGGVEIAVTDTGPGISKEDQTRIFEPFERARGDKSGGGRSGAGLGLTLVRNIVQMHGGSIRLESMEGKGTRVSIFLPAHASQN